MPDEPDSADFDKSKAELREAFRHLRHPGGSAIHCCVSMV